MDIYETPSVADIQGNRNTSQCSAVSDRRHTERQVQTANEMRGSLGSVDRFSVFSTIQALFTSLFDAFASLIGGSSNREPATVRPQTEAAVEVSPVPESIFTDKPPAGYITALSMKRNGEKPDDIWGGFRQGPDGNCVTVSAIKAAMHRFGQSPTDIYKEVTKTEDGYRVVMRDNFTLTLSEHELRQAEWGSNFLGRDREMLKDAHFLYAVSVKRAQIENNDGTAGRSFQAAMRSLNDKEDEFGPGEGLERLGLRQHMRTVRAGDLASGQVGICNRSGHSVAVINGIEEQWGKPGSAPLYGDAIALM
ncbi:hypothetical protein [Pseudomonas sp. B22129]|uniref:hypothetical protein n=1 Tax=Pseudomonas sp. B22129 TaxID=3235111 RepID=UPI003783C899